jgi:hypothetical protein
VKERLKKWPEKGERKLSWVSTKEAVRLIGEPGLIPLLLRLMGIRRRFGQSRAQTLVQTRQRRSRLAAGASSLLDPSNAADHRLGFAAFAEIEVRSGLRVGGNRIRTIGPP